MSSPAEEPVQVLCPQLCQMTRVCEVAFLFSPPSWSSATGCPAATAAATAPGLSVTARVKSFIICSVEDEAPPSALDQRNSSVPAGLTAEQPVNPALGAPAARAGRSWCSEVPNGELGQVLLLLETPPVQVP